jgi:metallo-beta-lactamase class B
MRRASVVLVVTALAFPGYAQISSDEERRWNAAVEPFRIVGNLYYVGATEVASYLVATPKGHIVIDSGFEETAPMVLSNIAKLGFSVQDVRFLLSSHAHYDHVGGMAILKAETRAAVVVSEADAALMASGGADDPQFGGRFPFTPVKAERILRDAERISLGGTVLTARITPGHTPGCTTWTMTLREKSKPYHVVIVCSASVPPQYKLTRNARYPNALQDYRRTFVTLKSLPCDIPLGSHPSFFNLMSKRERPSAFIDPEGYKAYVTRAEAAFEAKAKQESER